MYHQNSLVLKQFELLNDKICFHSVYRLAILVYLCAAQRVVKIFILIDILTTLISPSIIRNNTSFL